MIIYYLLGFINLVTFAVFGIDKFKAVGKFTRIPEYVLILLSLLGGSAGSWLGMYIWRHKIRKGKFVILIPAILLIHTALGIWIWILVN